MDRRCNCNSVGSAQGRSSPITGSIVSPSVEISAKLERVTGIEPAFSAWEADVLPLNYTREVLADPSKRPGQALSEGIAADRRDHRVIGYLSPLLADRRLTTGASMSPLMQGGVIMLLAQCGTDLSSLQSEISQRFYDAMTAGRDTEMVMAMLKQRVLLPGEDRAYLLAQSMQHYKVMVVSPDEACERLARACHFIAVRDMTEAVDLAESLVGGRPNALVLSDAHYTLPVYSPAMQYASQQTRDDALNLTWLDGLDDIDVEKLLDASDAE